MSRSFSLTAGGILRTPMVRASSGVAKRICDRAILDDDLVGQPLRGFQLLGG